MSKKVADIREQRVANLKYILFAGGDVPSNYRDLHDSAYRLWARNWEETFRELHSEAKVRADDFVRQRVISGLFDGENAVGLLLHTYLNLDLEAVRSHEYMRTYPPALIQGLRQEGAARVLTMEYLTLHPEWRRSAVGVPLADVILGLGVKVFEESGFPAMLVVTRNEKRVNKILYGHGARCLAPGLTKHNVEVDIVSLDSGKTHAGADPEANRWIEHFWQMRLDLAGVASIPVAGIRKSA